MACPPLESHAMKLIKIVMIGAVGVSMLGLTGCISKDTKFAWGTDEGVKTSGASGQLAVPSRPPLDVPPSLLGKVTLPHAEQVATVQDAPKRIVKALSGKQVALNAKIYEKTTSEVFSAVLDAMIGLKLPVQAVDSASGTLTTDWIHKKSDMKVVSNIFGGNSVVAVRYRFVTRVLNQTMKSEAGTDKRVTRFEVHTIAQGYKDHKWSNIKLARRFANELFSRVDENLASSSKGQE